MLSGKLLEQIVRSSPLQERLITLAWPSLSTESKLQVIDEIAGSTRPYNTPPYLVDLALNDQAAIVRFWAIKNASLSSNSVSPLGEALGIAGPTDKAIARYEKASNDLDETVRACLTDGGFMYRNFHDISQLERLVHLRKDKDADIENFTKFLNEAIDAGKISDDDLADCLHEFLESDAMKKELERKIHPDPMGEMDNEQGMKNLWSLSHKAGPRLKNIIQFGAPMKIGKAKMTKVEILNLPHEVISNLVYREEKEAQEAVSEIRNHPERFSSKTVEEISKHDEWMAEILDFDDDLDKEEQRLSSMTNREESMMKAIYKLRRELESLKQLIIGSSEKKRSFFG